VDAFMGVAVLCCVEGRMEVVSMLLVEAPLPSHDAGRPSADSTAMIGTPRPDATRAARRTGVTKRLHGGVYMACGLHPPLLIPDFEANLAIR
jgi:hypothetical protein